MWAAEKPPSPPSLAGNPCQTYGIRVSIVNGSTVDGRLGEKCKRWIWGEDAEREGNDLGAMF